MKNQQEKKGKLSIIQHHGKLIHNTVHEEINLSGETSCSVQCLLFPLLTNLNTDDE